MAAHAASDFARLFAGPGAFGRVTRAAAYLWRHGPRATAAALRIGMAPTYADWIAAYDEIDAAARETLTRRAAQIADAPLISLIAAADDEALRAAAEAQVYPHWEIVADLAAAKGEAVVFCGPGAAPREHALLLIAERLRERPQAQVIYWDEDVIGARGARADPWFKPDWDPDLHRAMSLFGGAVAVRAEAARGTGACGPSDPALTALAAASGAEHIPHVLFHRHADASPTPAAPPPAPRPLSPAPKVSIIIPTTDRLDLLRPCLEGVLTRTDYPDLEVIVVDCASREPETAAWLEDAKRDPRLRLVRREGLFNFSAANNLAARSATGEVLLLLNNDTEVIEPGWLAILVGELMRPEIGAVGAKLLYPSGHVQHAGMCFQDDQILHLGLGLGRADPGYRGAAVLSHRVSAVTGACLAVRRATFEQLGGLNENYRVSFNDVDLCLRIRATGLAVLYAAEARLTHIESATRHPRNFQRRLEARRQHEHARRQLGDADPADPYLNPNLAVRDARETPDEPPPFGPGWGLAFPPRVPRPWGAR
jgi:GT2 family glycosyltransferase